MRRQSAADVADVELVGPWSHRQVSANGARFHICESLPASSRHAPPGSPAPSLVLLLHGFPEFWWAWRHQLPALASHGHHAVAMDLRGYGGSDKTPRGYDALTLAEDVAGVVRALGARSAVLIGQGWGGYVAWTAAAHRADCVRAIAAVSAPHPRVLVSLRHARRARYAARHLLAMQVPWLPERRIRRGDYVAAHLADWAAPDGAFPSPEESDRYTSAFAQWPSPHCALEYHRWLVRSRIRSDGREFARTVKPPIAAPVLYVTGAEDPADPGGGSAGAADSARRVSGAFTHTRIEGAGHFPHEEQPERLTSALLSWLSQLPPAAP